MPTPLRNVRSQGQTGNHVLALSFSGFDPTETLAAKFAVMHNAVFPIAV
jgi:hypothetical protein